MFFGAAYIRLTESGELNIHAPAGTNIDTPATTNTGTLTTQGKLTYQDGLAGFGGANGTAISGNLVHTAGSITSLGKKIDGTHTHGGVQAGGSNTAVPNA
jgi:phage baseplate assembly protein gpV